jgi:arylsulfatase A-like enzyme
MSFTTKKLKTLLLKSSYFLVIICLCASCSENQNNVEKVNSKPNIILFYADDLGWMDLAVQGSKYYETPNIDRIAQGGMNFTNAYANAANCAPSRACLMTGLYTPRHGLYTVSNPARGKTENRKLIPIENKRTLDSTFLTLPSFLKNKGYQTAIAGKWHITEDPTKNGFDTNFGGSRIGLPSTYFSPYNNPKLPDGPDGEHLPDRLANDMSNWIKQHKSTPFFAYFSFYSVHTPIEARADLIKKYQQKSPEQYHNKPEYAAMIEAMDLAVGKVLHTVDSLKLADNTIIIFTADNGAHGGQTLSRPLRGAKGMFYEGGIREPFFIQWPRKVKPNTVNATPVIGSDIFPTIADIMRDKTVENQLDGISILPLLEEKSIADRALYWHFPAYLQMYKDDRSFEDSHDKPWFRTTPVSVIRDGDWKLLEYFETGDLELYNLKDDIGEQHNLVDANPDKLKQLHQKLKAWRIETNAPVPTELNPDYVTGIAQ